eukprot:7649604-Alexandrium_andersonii.AAC.1
MESLSSTTVCKMPFKNASAFHGREHRRRAPCGLSLFRTFRFGRTCSVRSWAPSAARRIDARGIPCKSLPAMTSSSAASVSYNSMRAFRSCSNCW